MYESEMTELKKNNPFASYDLQYSCAVIGEREVGIIILRFLVIPSSCRRLGFGTRFMVDICKFADDINSILMLSPTMDLGATSINRLKKFYKRFGFVENSGKRKMYELPLLKMYRLPRNMKDA